MLAGIAAAGKIPIDVIGEIDDRRHRRLGREVECEEIADQRVSGGGDHAATARQKTEQMLLGSQAADGAWLPRNGNEKSAGPVYATSLALLSLSVYHHFLPIYQK